MIYTKHIALTIGIILMTTISCNKEKDQTVKENFLGRWIQVQIGNYPSLEPYNDPENWGIEFLEDSVFHFIDDTGILGTEKYWVDSIVHIQYIRNNTILFTEEYKYEFISNNKLLLETINAAPTYTTSIYLRKN